MTRATIVFLLVLGLTSCAALAPGPAPSLMKKASPSIRSRRRLLTNYPTSYPTSSSHSAGASAASSGVAAAMYVYYGIIFFCCGLPALVAVLMLALSPCVIGILAIQGCAAPTLPDDLHFMACPGAFFCIPQAKLPMVYSDKLLIFAAMLLEIFFYPGCGFILIGALSKNSGDPVAQQGKQQWIILGAIYFLVPFAMQFLAWLNVIIVPFMVFYSFCHLYSMVSVFRTIFKADAAKYFEAPPQGQALPTSFVKAEPNFPPVAPQIIGVQQPQYAVSAQVVQQPQYAAPQPVYAQPQVIGQAQPQQQYVQQPIQQPIQQPVVAAVVVQAAPVNQ